jgi:hypothetical protein
MITYQLLPVEVVARKNCTVTVLDVISIKCECLVIQSFFKRFLVFGVFYYCFCAIENSEVPVQRCGCSTDSFEKAHLPIPL